VPTKARFGGPSYPKQNREAGGQNPESQADSHLVKVDGVSS